MVDYVELAKQYNLSNDVDKILLGIKSDCSKFPIKETVNAYKTVFGIRIRKIGELIEKGCDEKSRAEYETERSALSQAVKDINDFLENFDNRE